MKRCAFARAWGVPILVALYLLTYASSPHEMLGAAALMVAMAWVVFLLVVTDESRPHEAGMDHP